MERVSSWSHAPGYWSANRSRHFRRGKMDRKPVFFRRESNCGLETGGKPALQRVAGGLLDSGFQRLPRDLQRPEQAGPVARHRSARLWVLPETSFAPNRGGFRPPNRGAISDLLSWKALEPFECDAGCDVRGLFPPLWQARLPRPLGNPENRRKAHHPSPRRDRGHRKHPGFLYLAS